MRVATAEVFASGFRKPGDTNLQLLRQSVSTFLFKPPNKLTLKLIILQLELSTSSLFLYFVRNAKDKFFHIISLGANKFPV
jgi:hypothetical protein